MSVQRSSITADDIASAEEILQQTYGNHQATVLGPVRAYRLRLDTVAAGALAIDRIRHTVTARFRCDPLDYILVDLPLRGRTRVATNSRDEQSFSPGEALLLPIGVPVTATLGEVDKRTLRLPLTPVTDLAAREFGIEAGNFRFESMATGPGMARYWRRTMIYLHQVMHNPEDTAGHPLLNAALVELAAAALLRAFPNTATSAQQLPEPGWAAPAVVRRAVAHIEAHAHEPVTIAGVAAAAGVGARSLQAAFRRHLDLTPSAYLRRVRLDRAHGELLATDAAGGTTVVDVARRWGFPNVDRFAAEYHAVYGRPPGDTLRS